MYSQQIIGFYVDPNFRSKTQLKDRLDKISRQSIVATISDSPYYNNIKTYCDNRKISLIALPPDFNKNQFEGFYDNATISRNKRFVKACDFIYLFGYDFSLQYKTIKEEIDLLNKQYEIVQNI